MTIRGGGRLWCCESRWSGTFLAITDRDGPKTCEHLLHIAGSDVHVDSVAHRLTAPQIWPRGISNPHWAPQHTFCGGLTNNSLRRYTFATDRPPYLQAACRRTMAFAHCSEKCLAWTWSITALPSRARTVLRHIVGAVGKALQYWADYELQELQNLPRDIEVACREKSGRRAII